VLFLSIGEELLEGFLFESKLSEQKENLPGGFGHLRVKY
jgi:hypothetical protein